ncbi:MAG TPA: hypothetical protein VE757_07045 [Gaiellaceae bacterium]|nr:hypothetical protein [Gaiellaceae bacterium]
MKLAVIFGLVVLVTGGWAFERQTRSGNERALGAVATELAGRPAHVRCESFWHWVVNVGGNLGDVPFPDGRAADYTNITRGMCGELARFRRQPERPELACLQQFDWTRFDPGDPAMAACSKSANDMAEALITLTHESMHIRGWADEAVAQCYAIQEVAFTVEQLGGSRAEGAAVAAYALALQAYMPTDYQSGDCAAGRSLDLRPETRAWPAEDAPGPLPAGMYGPEL